MTVTQHESPVPVDAGSISDQIPPIEQLVKEIVQRVRVIVARTPHPSATYRVQFQKDFTFRDAERVVPYLSELGITHVYASPYLKARTGSEHGYDIVDHAKFNPVLGTDSDFAAFVSALQSKGMGHVLDFVPNHMGIGSDENAWWQDVLENGPCSEYAAFFDVDWHPLKSDLTNKVLLPVLGEQFGQVLESQQLALQFSEGTFSLSYSGRRFPLGPRSCLLILNHRVDEIERRLGDDPQLAEYQSILTALGHLPPREVQDPARIQERQREKDVIRRRLHRLCDESPLVLEFIRENVAVFNGIPGDPRSFDLLDALLNEQAYRLSYWRVAADEVNYRRFFDINELAAICMENPVVFDKAHVRVMQLLQDGQLDGLRIDHADGLYDPTGYLWQLQRRRFIQLCRQAYEQWRTDNALPEWNTIEPALGTSLEQSFDELRHSNSDPDLLRPLYVVVEKILEGPEPLPLDWPVYGTTGYEFLNMVNGLFVRGDNLMAMDAVYRQFTRDTRPFDELVYQSKRLIMRVSMAGELNVLGHQLDRISERDRRSRDFTENGLTHALREIVACFPVYRTYTTQLGVLDRDRRYIEQAVLRAKRRNPAVSHIVFDFVRDLLLLKFSEGVSPELQRMVVSFIGRFQQFTGPTMAKAVEDTAFYNFQRLVSLNEVGGDPQHFGVTIDAFHAFNRTRWQSQPWALSATATHDMKRGEDTRARINVLSEIPNRWKECALRWARWNKRKKTKVDGDLAPSRSDEYLLYQTLLGTWPFDPPQGESLATYVQRIQQYMTKAQREGKVNSSWIAPNEPYEKATHDFIAAILSDQPMSGFRTDYEPFAREIAGIGSWNSLSQTLLKLASPGVPDIFQGTELWDLSLVDPDNRRSIDYPVRQQMLAELNAAGSEADSRLELAQRLVAAPDDGKIKLFIISKVLQLRRDYPQLFTTGEYLPIESLGERAHHVLAFIRRDQQMSAIVIAPVQIATLVSGKINNIPPLGFDVWGQTRLKLPDDLQAVSWRHLFTNQTLAAKAAPLVADILRDFPVAILVRSEGERRSAPSP